MSSTVRRSTPGRADGTPSSALVELNAFVVLTIPMIFERRQAGGVLGWTAAIAAFGPFLFGVGLTVMSPTLFYAIGVVWAIAGTAIAWFRYARPGAPKPS